MNAKNQTRITLSQVKFAAWASQETNCFSATLLFDGKPMCRVSNEGHGGPDLIESLARQPRTDTLKAMAPVFAFAKSLDPDPEFPDLEINLEIVVGELMNTWIVEAELRRSLSRNFLWLRADKPGIWMISKKKAATVAADYPTALRARHPGVEFRFFHEMALSVAVEEYRKGS